MYARIERFNLAQGFAELAEELADRIAPIMRRQPGLQTMTMLSDESSGEYMLLTHWETLEQIGTYERSADEWCVRDVLSQHITAVPVIEVFQVHTLSAPAAGDGSGESAAGRAAHVSARAAQPLAATQPVGESGGAVVAPAPPVSVAVAPSVQRAREAGVTASEPSDGQCPASHPVKGNHSRTGDFIYHVPGSRFYDRTAPEVCFASEDEALAAGFRAPRA